MFSAVKGKTLARLMSSSELSHGPPLSVDDNHIPKYGEILPLVACGTTEFGPFISAGFARKVLEKQVGAKNLKDAVKNSYQMQVVLARRYIADNDGRNDVVKFKKDLILMLLNEERYEIEHELFWGKVLPRKCARNALH